VSYRFYPEIVCWWCWCLHGGLMCARAKKNKNVIKEHVDT